MWKATVFEEDQGEGLGETKKKAMTLLCTLEWQEEYPGRESSHRVDPKGAKEHDGKERAYIPATSLTRKPPSKQT